MNKTKNLFIILFQSKKNRITQNYKFVFQKEIKNEQRIIQTSFNIQCLQKQNKEKT